MNNKKIISCLALALVIIVSFLLGFYQISPMSAERENQKTTGFSLDKALQHIKVIARSPHPVGSVQNKAVREYIENYLKGMGLYVELEKETVQRRGKTYTVENVLAKIDGSDKEGINVMLSAHYDSTPNGPGAADNGAGVASVLEAVRIIKAEGQPKNNMYILFSDGEEVGLIGAEAFAKTKSDRLKDMDFVVNFEARGNQGPVIMFESSDKNLGLINAFRKVAPNPIGFSFSQDIYKRMPNDTDFTVFKDAGIKGMNFAAFDGFDAYHTQKDTVENLNINSLEHYGTIAETIAGYYGNISRSEFEKINAQKDTDAVYFPLFKGNLIVYSQKAVVLIMLITLLGFLLTIIVSVRRKAISIKNILLGSLFCLGMIIAACGISIPVIKLITIIHNLRARGFTIESFKYSNLYIVIISVALIFLIYAACRMFTKKIKHLELICGGVVIWSIILLLTSIYLKGSSYIFQWPLIPFIIFIAYIAFRGIERVGIIEKTILLSVACFTTIMVFLPVIYMVYIAMTIGILPVLSFLVTVPAVPLLSLVMFIFNNKKQRTSAGINRQAEI